MHLFHKFIDGGRKLIAEDEDFFTYEIEQFCDKCGAIRNIQYQRRKVYCFDCIFYNWGEWTENYIPDNCQHSSNFNQRRGPIGTKKMLMKATKKNKKNDCPYHKAWGEVEIID